MDSRLNLMKPLEQSFAFDETEAQLKALYIDVFNELFADKVDDIHHYGMPHLGSATVVERFTKQDGLVVLRRPNSNDQIMRVIYANWISLGSKRGLAFLEFVLQMLIGDQWQIHRLYHDKNRVEQYPSLVTMQKLADSFLTSRIMIDLDASVDFNEILELLPTLMRLVPANIVPTLTSSLSFSDIAEIQIATGFIPYMMQDFKYFDYGDLPIAPMTEWIISRVVVVRANGQAIYGAKKTNGVDVYQSYAYTNMRYPIQLAIPRPEYRESVAILEAAQRVYPNAVSARVEGSQVKISDLPEEIDHAEVMGVLLQRLAQVSEPSDYDWIGSFDVIVESAGWVRTGHQVFKTLPAPLSMTSANRYSIGDQVSYQRSLEAAQMHVKSLLANDPDWAGVQILSLTLERYEALQDSYVLSYQKDGEILELYMVVTKSENPDFVVVDATIDVEISEQQLKDHLVDLVRQSQIGATLARTSAVNTKNAIENLVDAAYSYDAFEPSNTLAISNEKTMTFDQISERMIYNLRNPNQTSYVAASEFINRVAMTIFEEDPDNILVNYADIVGQFDDNSRELIFVGDPLDPIGIDLEVLEHG